MSEMTASPIGQPAVDPTDSEIAALPPARPWLQQVWRYTIVRPSAKFGLVWIGIVAFCAVFAPLLANSFPLAAKIDGKWSSPAWQHITAADVALLLVAGLAVV